MASVCWSSQSKPEGAQKGNGNGSGEGKKGKGKSSDIFSDVCDLCVGVQPNKRLSEEPGPEATFVEV